MVACFRSPLGTPHVRLGTHLDRNVDRRLENDREEQQSIVSFLVSLATLALCMSMESTQGPFGDREPPGVAASANTKAHARAAFSIDKTPAKILYSNRIDDCSISDRMSPGSPSRPRVRGHTTRLGHRMHASFRSPITISQQQIRPSPRATHSMRSTRGAHQRDGRCRRRSNKTSQSQPPVFTPGPRRQGPRHLAGPERDPRAYSPVADRGRGTRRRRGDPYDHRYLGLRDAVRPGSKAVAENSNIPSVIDRGPGCGFPPDPALRVNSLALRSSPSPICISSTQAKSRRWTVFRHSGVWSSSSSATARVRASSAGNAACSAGERS